MRQTPNSQQVCTFGIATNRQWVSKDGSKHSSAEFHELVAWARLADICGKYLRKGKLIYVEGYLKTRAWDTPEGIRRHKTEVIVQDMIMLEKRPRDGEDDLDEISVASAENMEEHNPDEPMPEPGPEMMDDKIEF